MRIVLTGGGSGGHITPILAVAHELKRLQPEAELIYIGQRGDGLLDILQRDPAIDTVHTVSAGKFRRYSGEGARQLLDVRTQALNLRDAVRVGKGIWQSYRLLGRIQPDVIFTRGGFVSVPVAIAGALRHIPYITHDSDSLPSLANRIIARWAHTHAVALPPEIYPYPAAKTVMVGVPVSSDYQPVTPGLQQQYRHEAGLDGYEQVILLTGGGNGAQRLNEALVANAPYLLRTYPRLGIVHITGRTLAAQTDAAYDTLRLGEARQRIRVEGFVTDLYRLSGAADVVIARGGATNLAEFAIQAKACVIVPAAQLVGGHQVKNTRTLAERGAVIMLDEDQVEQPERLGRTVGDLLDEPDRRAALGKAFAQFAHPQAAAELAALVLRVAEEKNSAAAT